jgi:glucose-6-phosphate 1-epimerase
LSINDFRAKDQRVALQPNSNIAKLYTKDFQLAYVVTLAEHELSTDIHVSNPSASEALDFQALLHTYIRAPANDVSISPLLGKLYIDKTEKSLGARNTLKEEKRSAVDVRTFTDSVHEDALISKREHLSSPKTRLLRLGY